MEPTPDHRHRFVQFETGIDIQLGRLSRTRMTTLTRPSRRRWLMSQAPRRSADRSPDGRGSSRYRSNKSSSAGIVPGSALDADRQPRQRLAGHAISKAGDQFGLGDNKQGGQFMAFGLQQIAQRPAAAASCTRASSPSRSAWRCAPAPAASRPRRAQPKAGRSALQ